MKYSKEELNSLIRKLKKEGYEELVAAKYLSSGEKLLFLMQDLEAEGERIADLKRALDQFAHRNDRETNQQIRFMNRTRGN